MRYSRGFGPAMQMDHDPVKDMALEYKRRDIYAAARELGDGATFSLAAIPEITLAADPFLDPRSTQ